MINEEIKNMLLLETEKFILNLKDQERADNTIKNYQLTLKQLDEYLIKNNVETLSKEVMVNWKISLKDKYSINTRNNKITLVNAYFKWSNQAELKVSQFKQQEEIHKEYLTYKEYKRLVQSIDKVEIKLLVYVIGNTGLRVGEVSNLGRVRTHKNKITYTKRHGPRKWKQR